MLAQARVGLINVRLCHFITSGGDTQLGWIKPMFIFESDTDIIGIFWAEIFWSFGNVFD